MSIVRRSAGIAIVFLSSLALLLCSAGVPYIWIAKGQVDSTAATLFETADDALAFMVNRLHQVQERLETSRERFTRLKRRADRLSATEADLPPELEPLLQTLDEIYGELQGAEHWLEACEAVARGVNRASVSMLVSESAGSPQDPDEFSGLTGARVAEFSAGVAEALVRLEVMRGELVSLRDKRVLAREFAAAMIRRVTELDAKLANVHLRIGDFKADVSAARASSIELRRTAQWWTAFAALTLMLVLVWFAVSQIGMMKYGLRLVARSEPR